jgi:mannose-6-phosphate isomerase-like protein (cupin superfamily)
MNPLPARLTPDLLQRLEADDAFKTQRFAEVFAHGSLSVELYAPRGVDAQTPHTRDEVYVVIAGRGQFFCDGETRDVGPGELLFVPAGMDHRFLDVSDDFATWVLFYGPEGGERVEDAQQDGT